MTVDVLAQSDLGFKIGAPDKDNGRTRTGFGIRHRGFLREVRQLKLLRSFQISEAIPDVTEASASFGSLFDMHYAPWGRLPSEDEWAQMDRLALALSIQLPAPLREKFIHARVPAFIAIIPVILIIIGCFSIILIMASIKSASEGHQALSYAEVMNPSAGSYLLHNFALYYIIWLGCMGSIGAVAFIGMNAISAQNDITFDLSNRRLMSLRIVLGGLFAIVLTLPLGSEGFVAFCYKFITGYTMTGAEADNNVSGIGQFGQALPLVMPFLLGFSTSLVILVLNQLIEGIQAFFGRRPGATREREPTEPGTIGRIYGTGSASTSAVPALLSPTPTS